MEVWVCAYAVEGSGCGDFRRHFVDARFQERRPRLGKPRRAKTMRGLVRIVPADVLAVGGKTGLVAGQIIGLGAILQPGVQSAVIGGHGRLGEGARMFDRLGRRLQGGPGRTPKARGARLAIGRLEDAGPELLRRQNGPVENVELERAGGNVGRKSQQAVGPSKTLDLDRRAAANIDPALLFGVRNDLANHRKPIDTQGVGAAGKLQLAVRAVEQERAPDHRRRAGGRIGGRRRGFGGLVRAAHFFHRSRGAGRDGARQRKLGGGRRGDENQANQGCG